MRGSIARSVEFPPTCVASFQSNVSFDWRFRANPEIQYFLNILRHLASFLGDEITFHPHAVVFFKVIS
jgi:hypothetical protein